MTAKSYPGAQPYFPEADREAILTGVSEILDSGQMTQSRYLEQFEEAAAEMARTRHAIAVNSGGTALELTMEALGVESGEVIVPTETFVASANSVARTGGIPVFADIDLSDLSLTVESIAAKRTSRTRGVMLVHMFGIMSPRIGQIQEYCRDNGLFLVEDAAHAHGGEYNGARAGSLGDAGCFSYYATKILTTGEGGLITTDDDGIAARVNSIRNHGREADGPLFDRAGNNFRLPEIPALIGVHQHRRLAEILAHRRRIAAIYRDALIDNEFILPIDPAPREGHTYWRYAALLEPQIDRAAVQREMLDRHGARITWMYEPLCHQQPYYAGQGAVDSLGNAEAVCGHQINLPTHSGVDDEGAVIIAEGLKSIVAELARR